jgi:segregation and condensation protein B
MADPSSAEFHEPKGISLNELTQAYAQAMGSSAGHAANEHPPTSPQPDKVLAEPTEHKTPDPIAIGKAEEPGAIESDGVLVSPLSVVEAILFVGSIDSRPLEAAKVAELMRGVSPGDVAQLIDKLNARFRSNGCPYKIVNDGGGYRMTLRRAFHPIRNKFYGKVREARLSQAAIDTLAIVAYRQPLTSEQVSQLRGTPSGHLLTQLVRRQLLEVERVHGDRQLLYRTSERFLELFGLDSLRDLPDSD